nr:late embryogenesis abundant protein, LEA-14 [Tanacetum cinerariifolium]
MVEKNDLRRLWGDLYMWFQSLDDEDARDSGVIRTVTQNWMVITFHVPFWNDKWLVQGGTALELASPEQTATCKDVSNPFMAVMVCQKPLGYFSSPLIHVLRAGLVINPPG